MNLSKLEHDTLAMINEARTTGKWFYCREQNSWLTPDDVELAVNNKSFPLIIDPEFWCLVDVGEFVEQQYALLQQAVMNHNEQIQRALAWQRKIQA